MQELLFLPLDQLACGLEIGSQDDQFQQVLLLLGRSVHPERVRQEPAAQGQCPVAGPAGSKLFERQRQFVLELHV